jgi:hypothetical protein
MWLFKVSTSSGHKLELPGSLNWKDTTRPNALSHEYELEILSMEDLKELQRAVHRPLIVDFESESIEIYDGYRE